MKEVEVKKLVKQLLKTINVMHKNNVKHGNLTLDSVLIKKKRDCLEILPSSFNLSTIEQLEQLRNFRPNETKS